LKNSTLRWISWALLLLTLWPLSGCSPVETEAPAQPPGQTLLLWHPFEAESAVVLNDILDEYARLHNLTIVREYVPLPEMRTTYEEKVALGLGPDIFIISQPFVGPIIRGGFVRSLDDFNIDTTIIATPAQQQIRWQGKLYGVPFSMITSMMCYNRALVDKPATQLVDLVEEVENGQQIAFVSSFARMFWGLSFYQGRLLDDNGRVALDQGGYVEWMSQLLEIRNLPNIILQDDPQAVRATFMAGQTAYYPCFSSEIPALRHALGQDKLGVTPLPRHMGRPAGPLMGVNTLFINRLAAEANVIEAVNLIEFLTNTQQQTRLALASEAQIPVNLNVQIDSQLSPTVAALVEQSKSAVAFPLAFQQQSSIAINIYGETFYTLVLEGEISPADAAKAIVENTHRDVGLE